MTKERDVKYREFWVYQFKAADMTFVYKKPQPIKQAAPENFEEYHVIEHQALIDEREKSKKLIEALESIAKTKLSGSDVYDAADSMACEARQAINEYDQNKTDT